MRTILSSFLAAAGLAVAAIPAAAQAGPKIAYIDSQQVIAQAPGAQEAQAAFEKEMAGYQAELRQLEEELQALMTEYEQQQVMLSPEARQERQDTIRQKQIEFQQRAAQLEQQAAQRQAQLVQPILERVNTVITAIREEEGYAMIFDAAGGSLLAADTTLDITDMVLARLRATAQNP